jgi:hypothetical protein
MFRTTGAIRQASRAGMSATNGPKPKGVFSSKGARAAFSYREQTLITGKAFI